MTVEWGWEKWTQTIFSILLIKQTKIISLRTLIIKQTKKYSPHWLITVYYPNKQKVSLRTLIIKQTKIIFPSLINHFLLPITEKLIIFGWGWGKVACQGFYHLGGGEQKWIQKWPAKVSQNHTAKVSQNPP